uniref:Alpha-conotoxin-like Br1.4 n=1 Tax=Conus brunneus TaxID=101289 RepID=CA14_CONBR|nr:RecName: Full=Alpha-conotoxin-like Br1.4 [Conus brunneus]
ITCCTRGTCAQHC